ncbi:MAG: helix-turn-helix transcriptional regulator [Devosia sp.]
MSTSPSASAGAARAVPGSADPALAAATELLLAAGYLVVPPVDATAPAHLSPREQQVAALLLEGASNKIIARRLEISVHTAKFHVTAVLDKLGARNRADAVAIIMREGLIAL